ncbi:UxaA family hydrolase [Bacillus piscicola]|uniref:UxaA family hydrolase n=1 Tax=Bacillus piscicola TaxID=1632684 RepID=UPI001F088901|nr:UxaA family hydrolase [Bacillus piscicola]
MHKAIFLNENDNVVTVVQDLNKGDIVIYPTSDSDKEQLTVKEEVPLGFKVALHDIARNEMVVKYGETIGTASAPILKGTIVHTHNLQSLRGRGDIE